MQSALYSDPTPPPATGSGRFEFDLLLIGGGIAGLWTLDLARQRGYRAVLLQHGPLGGTQTMAAQGLIHGGIKYALDGTRGAAATAIAEMPDFWLRCLEGSGPLDLRSVRVLSPATSLWTTATPMAALGGLLASKLMRARVSALAPAQHPAELSSTRFAGTLYRVAEPVIEVGSLVAVLAARNAGAIFQIDRASARLLQDAEGTVTGMDLAATSGPVRVRARRTLLCAGAGNAELLRQLDVRTPAMQLRPLHQVLLKHPRLPEWFGHCVGSRTTPLVTLSSHDHSDGERIWYLGGGLAENGVARTPAAQIERARQELVSVFPGLELDGAAWRTLRVERAEPLQPDSARPADAWCDRVPGHQGLLIGWPTKLALAPRLAARMLDLVAALPPSGSTLEPGLAAALAPAALAQPPWEYLFS